MNESCHKKKFKKIDAMIILANITFEEKKTKGKTNRKEKRYYWCKECQSYHLTSQEKNKKRKEI